MIDKLYTVKEVLDLLRISRATLYRHIASGLIKPLKLGGKTLFTESALKAMIEKLNEQR